MSQKKHIFELFAMGKTPDEVARILDAAAPPPDAELSESSVASVGAKPHEAIAPARKAGRHISKSAVEKLFLEYLDLPMNAKLRETMMVDQIANRPHRLMDDFADIMRIDELLAQTDKSDVKTLVSLLDIKRKIKERMAKEDAPPSGADAAPASAEENTEGDLDECYKRVFGAP